MVQGSHLSNANTNDTIRAKVTAAYKALHKQRVLHGDIRRENVLVLEDESVRIIDFDKATILPEIDEDLLLREEEDVASMLDELKGQSDGSVRNGSVH